MDARWKTTIRLAVLIAFGMAAACSGSMPTEVTSNKPNCWEIDGHIYCE